jgi:hypothetical protein
MADVVVQAWLLKVLVVAVELLAQAEKVAVAVQVLNNQVTQVVAVVVPMVAAMLYQDNY